MTGQKSTKEERFVVESYDALRGYRWCVADDEKDAVVCLCQNKDAAIEVAKALNAWDARSPYI